MAKIFSQQAELNNHPARNNFDLSHKVHMSGKMGVLYPNFCKPVVPGDTFRISSGCAINFMPMPYPTQTRMRFIQHFFYVRNKNIWENWENWLQGLEEHVPPYIDQPKEFYETGSLADFLGIPTERVEIENRIVSVQEDDMVQVDYDNASILRRTGISSVTGSDIYGGQSLKLQNPDEQFFRFIVPMKESFKGRLGDFLNGYEKILLTANLGVRGVKLAIFASVDISENSSVPPVVQDMYASDMRYIGDVFTYDIRPSDPSVEHVDVLQAFSITGGDLQGSAFNLLNDKLDMYESEMRTYSAVEGIRWRFAFIVDAICYDPKIATLNLITGGAAPEGSVLDFDHRVSELDGLEYSNPYYSSENQSSDTIRISALPFRAYESIYNAFYRNQHGNQPFIVNGQTKYNVYNTTKADGADTTPYKLMFRNWELDAYTSALPSPQQGPAPLVGISALGRVTIVDPETGVTTTAQATDTANGIQISDVELGEAGHQRYLVNLAQSGITINDFRQVNALQRFLETNIRKGFRYVDFIEGHFGHRIKDAVMDMPEFIGGYSENVNVNMVTNTTQPNVSTSENALGNYAGQASAFGGSSHNITHFCDDYGFIIGIVCLVPDPTYSQILPKYFNVKNPLDYYFPEFSQIGMQPITYEELCPIQSHAQYLADGTSKLTDVFGYQRPNHDMVWYPDTIHGEFRRTFNTFLVNRLFTKRPVLGNDFLVIKPEETNNIFSYTRGDSDVFVGQFAFDVKAKRPLPRIIIPGLGH